MVVRKRRSSSLRVTVGAMPYRVYAAAQRLEPAGRKPVRYRMAAEPELHKLRPRHDSVLPRCQLGHRPIH